MKLEIDRKVVMSIWSPEPYEPAPDCIAQAQWNSPRRVLALTSTMASPRLHKTIGCIGVKSTHRVLLCGGLLLFTCYLVSELALRSWTLDESYNRHSPLCSSQQSFSPRFPGVPCSPPRATPPETEGKIDGKSSDDAKWNETQYISWVGHYEIVVDSADLRSNKWLGKRDSNPRRQPRQGGKSFNLQVERTPPLVHGSARPLHLRPAGNIKNSRFTGPKVNPSLIAFRGTWNASGNSHNHNDSRTQFSTAPEVVALERRFYVRRVTKVNAHDFKVTYNASCVCREPPFLIVIIPSLPSSRDRRDAIRDTWGSVANTSKWLNETLNEKVKIVFLLGRTESDRTRRALEEEYTRYGDFLQEDFLESYRNLSLKTVMGLKWVVNYCNRARYVMKCDDDMIAHIPMILRLLTKKKYRSSIIGHINKGAMAQRQGLWRVSPDEFPFQYFPPYASGSAYILSADIIEGLYDMSEHVPLIPIEDVYVTGVLGKIIGVTLVHEDGFTSWNAFSPRTCDLALGRIFTGTKMTSNSLRRMWQRLQNGGLNCNRDTHQLMMRSMY